MEIARLLHVLGVVVWIGGMFFAYMALRPAALKILEPAQRLPLWAATFANFFPWVWASVGLILVSGLYMFFRKGGFTGSPGYVFVMFVFGLTMMAIFGHVYFAPFRKLKRYVALKDWPQAGAALNQMRMLVGLNLFIGIATVTVATAGPIFR